MELVLISAVTRNNVIGNKGELPWPNLKEDFRHFRDLTMNHPVIMGRVTFEGIIKRLGKPLPYRENIVLSRDCNFKPTQGVIVCRGINEALDNAVSLSKVAYVIGGQKIYESTIQLARRLELTEIHEAYPGDAFFPDFDKNRWNKSFQGPFEESGLKYYFTSYVRK